MNWFTRTVTPTQIRNVDRLWLYAIGALGLIFLLVPTLIVIPMSFSDSQYLEFPPKALSLKWYQNYFGSSEWMRATLVSLRAAFLTSIFATTIGTAAAYGTWVGTARFRTPLSGLFILPLSVPSILVAIGSLFVFQTGFGQHDVRPGSGSHHAGDTICVHRRNGRPDVLRFEPGDAARSLGASRVRAFFTVTLPQIKFSVITSALFAFYVSLDEVIVAMFISTGTGGTLNRKMFNALRDQVDPTIAAISTCMVAVSVILLLLAQKFQPKQTKG